MIERGKAQQVQVYDQVGETTVALPAKGDNPVIGEGTFTVNFLNHFVTKPTFTFGSEMAGNYSPIKQSFPTFSATVYHWLTKPAGHATVYIGAKVCFVAGGTAGSQLICHYSFRGRAMSALDVAANDTGTA
jgi:hypothetical protein